MVSSAKVTDFDTHIASKLKALRVGAGEDSNIRLTLVAAFLGMKYQSYQKMEAGKVSFRASTLRRLADFYGVPVSYFYDDSPVPPVPNQDEIGVVSALLRDVPNTVASKIVMAVKQVIRVS